MSTRKLPFTKSASSSSSGKSLLIDNIFFMDKTVHNMKDTFCIASSLFGPGRQECGSCYLISMHSVIGIIVSDIFLTIFIAGSVFYLLTLLKKRTERDAKIHAEPEEITESPYQELHGIQSDVYSELQHFRK
ncbi:TYRO protein tyrosine kinase-binding protein isoform X1 [Hippocampus comes]|uniref:TYRO protein tyrosine kinase-binding protein isoform X1 n=1 Tax=Hippocampus comes TaxID=109280 RepID=UPI00094F2175|nr:PREDICTED: TYRO protein tyrosine kinase-binding protein isoform X1 [Hippocampus comes]